MLLHVRLQPNSSLLGFSWTISLVSCMTLFPEWFSTSVSTSFRLLTQLELVHSGPTEDPFEPGAIMTCTAYLLTVPQYWTNHYKSLIRCLSMYTKVSVALFPDLMFSSKGHVVHHTWAVFFLSYILLHRTENGVYALNVYEAMAFYMWGNILKLLGCIVEWTGAFPSCETLHLQSAPEGRIPIACVDISDQNVQNIIQSYIVWSWKLGEAGNGRSVHPKLFDFDLQSLSIFPRKGSRII